MIDDRLQQIINYVPTNVIHVHVLPHLTEIVNGKCKQPGKLLASNMSPVIMYESYDNV